MYIRKLVKVEHKKNNDWLSCESLVFVKQINNRKKMRIENKPNWTLLTSDIM